MLRYNRIRATPQGRYLRPCGLTLNVRGRRLKLCRAHRSDYGAGGRRLTLRQLLRVQDGKRRSADAGCKNPGGDASTRAPGCQQILARAVLQFVELARQNPAG